MNHSEGKKVLIVDDEPYILKSLAYIFKKNGFRIATAIDGYEAIDRARAFRPDVVFLDLMLPRIDGFEVCRTIKRDPALSTIHVILLTAKGQESDKEAGYEAGADDFVTKPFSPHKVLEKVRELFDPSTASKS